jgi:GTPase SAR1 family protein
MVQLNDHASTDDLAKLLVGNKSDLEASREVSKEKAQQFCQQYGMEMLETSAKSGENVLQAFEKLICIVHDRALSANRNKGGIQGISNGGTTSGQGHPTLKLEDNSGNDPKAGDAGSCGC